jgi:hypothetical protein
MYVSGSQFHFALTVPVGAPSVLFSSIVLLPRLTFLLLPETASLCQHAGTQPMAAHLSGAILAASHQKQRRPHHGVAPFVSRLSDDRCLGRSDKRPQEESTCFSGHGSSLSIGGDSTPIGTLM